MKEDERDHVRELLDRLLEKMRRGEEIDFEFETEWAGLTDEERDDLTALAGQLGAHLLEAKEAGEAKDPVYKALLRLQVEQAPGMTLQEAIGSGRIKIDELVETIRAVPDPLA